MTTVTPVGPLRVRVGEPINLECQASGEPRPSVSWHRLDRNRKTMLSSPVPMDSNAVMQVLAPVCTSQLCQHLQNCVKPSMLADENFRVFL